MLEKTYTFNYFDPIHIHAILTISLIFGILLIIPYFFKGIERRKYTTFLGIFAILFKTFDSFYRVIFEHEKWFNSVPLNLCNIAIIIGGLYLITRKNIFFNILYFWFSGAILAIILPDIKIYYHPIYVYIFMGTHLMEIFIVLYGFIHLDEPITFKGLIVSLISFLGLICIAKIWNYIFGTNYLFVDNYIIPAINFIKPFGLYVFLFITLYMLSMIVIYLPFINNQNEEIEEEIIE